MAESFYDVLGVPKTADAAAIKKAYRKLARDLHPDRNPGNKKAEDRFKSVNRAFEALGDAKKRALYDEFGEESLSSGFDADKVRAYKNWSTQQGRGGGGGSADPFGQGVRLEDLFGGNVRSGSTEAGDVFSDLFGRSRRRGPQKGQDFASEVTVDFAGAVRGTMVELRPGGGEGAPVTVRIPAGADEGSRVRIAGQGGPSPNGGPPGDLLLEIHVQPHPHFRREGDDLHLAVPITVAEAYLGAKVKVPTIDGSVSLKVPPKSQSGTMVRLRGKGVALPAICTSTSKCRSRRRTIRSWRRWSRRSRRSRRKTRGRSSCSSDPFASPPSTSRPSTSRPFRGRAPRPSASRRGPASRCPWLPSRP
jgi:curved DNA-binding protein